MVCGLWFVVRGSWSVVRGPWFVVRGLWFVVCGSWFVVRERGRLKILKATIFMESPAFIIIHHNEADEQKNCRIIGSEFPFLTISQVLENSDFRNEKNASSDAFFSFYFLFTIPGCPDGGENQKVPV